MALSRRSMLIGLGGLIAGGGALVGTGAFTTVQAERTVDIETAGDANAFLTLEPAQNQNGNEYPNAQEYVTSDGSNGPLEITIPEVNLNAITKIDRVFQITNNGTQDVVIYLEELPGGNSQYATSTDFGTLDSELTNPGQESQQTWTIPDPNVVSISSSTPPGNGAGYDEIGVLLKTGYTLEIGVYIDTSDNNIADGLNESSNYGVAGANEDLLGGLKIHASATEAENNNYLFISQSN